jgi:hypothetical protein
MKVLNTHFILLVYTFIIVVVVCTCLCYIKYPSQIEDFTGSLQVTIVVAHYQEDLDWLKSTFHPIVLCDKLGSATSHLVPDTKCTQPINIGREFSSYLKYIIEYYDKLPPFVAFIHGHENAWHQNLPFTLLDGIKRAKIEEYDYISLNNFLHLKIPNYPKVSPNIWPSGNQIKEGHYAFDTMEKIWPIFESILHVPFPTYFRYDCGAQFIVSKKAILSNSKETYVKLYELSIDESYNNYEVGIGFEMIWHMLFSVKKSQDICMTYDFECNNQSYVKTFFR